MVWTVELEVVVRGLSVIRFLEYQSVHAITVRATHSGDLIIDFAVRVVTAQRLPKLEASKRHHPRTRSNKPDSASRLIHKPTTALL
jgi:hypothetical protein